MRLAFTIILFCFCNHISAAKAGQTHYKCHFIRVKALKGIPEPSDVAYDKESGHLFIVSDHGYLFECDTNGTIIRKAKKEGVDFEGITIKDGSLYVSDETPRKVYKYRKSDLQLEQVFNVSWAGAMNRAFESIIFNEIKNCFVLIAQEPAVIVEYDTAFKELHRQPFKASRDASGARWHNGYMYLLSNKDRRIFKCDPNTYAPLEDYLIDVLNPEGLDFGPGEEVYITSDDLQRLYYFKNLTEYKNDK